MFWISVVSQDLKHSYRNNIQDGKDILWLEGSGICRCLIQKCSGLEYFRR